MHTTIHIFPSTAAVDAFNRRTLEGGEALFGTAALTLSRLVEETARMIVDDRRHVSPTGRRLLIGEVIRARYDGGRGYFGHLWQFPGFIGALESFFGEMKQALLTPGAVAAAAAPGNARLRELALLFDLYCRALASRGLRDDHDREASVLDHLRSGGPPPPFLDDAVTLRVTGIYDFTPLQLALLAEFARRLRVVIRLPYNPDREALYAYAGKAADAIEALDNSELQLETDFVEPEGTFFTPYLAAVFDREEGGNRVPPPLPLAVFSAPGGYRECEEIGRRIRELLAHGTTPSAIAVLFRDTESYGPMMEDVCRRFRIPVSYRRGMPLFVSPLVRTCLAPFAVVASSFGREELLELWKSTYVDLTGGGVSGDLLEETLLEARYLDARQGSVEEVLDRRIAQLKRQGKNHEKTERVLEKVAPLMNELRGFGEEQTLREFIARLEQFIARHRIYSQGITAADPRALKRDASAIALMQQVLRELEDDMGSVGLQDERLCPEAFAALIEQGMAGKFLSGEKSEGVVVLNFHDARGLHFEHLFIGGLNEGICPAVPVAHPFFKESDKILCNRATGTRLFRTDSEKALEEPLLFHLALACAGRSLTLSSSYVDSRGNEMLRSPYLEELLEVVETAETRLDISLITPPIMRCYEREELLNALAAEGHLQPSPDLAPLLADSLERIVAGAAMEEQRATFFATAEKSARSDLSSPYTGTLRRRDILELLTSFYESAPGNRFAPTMLEEYGSCPFRYFLKRHLRLAPLDAPGMELATKDAGSVIHEILRNVCQRLSREGMFPLRDLAAARAILEEESGAVFAGWERVRHTGAALLWETEKKKLLDLLSQWLEAESCEEDTLVPRAFELPFEELEVADSDGSRLYLQGKIDRVDLDPAAGVVRVVDYKMSGNSQKYTGLLKKEALGETSFQMPVYLLAAACRMGESFDSRFDHFIARYWLLKKGGYRDKDFSAAGKEDYTGFFASAANERGGLAGDNFLNRLCAKVRAIKRGDFQITPQGCESCDFASICRYVDVMTYDE